MAEENYFKSSCPNCGGHIEFPRAAEGRTISCPHCQWDVELLDPAAKVIAPARSFSRGTLLLLAMIVGLAVIAVGVWAARKNAEMIGAARKETAKPPVVIREKSKSENQTKILVAKKVRTESGLVSGEMALEKTGSRLLYVVGAIQNTSSHQAFGVKVDLDLFDAHENKIGTTSDYTSVIEPGKEWKFKALVTDGDVARAEIVSIKEN